MKFIFSLIAISFLIFCKSQTITDCSGKAIIDENGLLLNDQTNDVTLAFNGPASCATLEAEGFCCYIKIKFENVILDEKFTHKGCYEITDSDSAKYVMGDSDDFDFKDVIIGGLENSFDTANRNLNLTYKSISVDCSSKYLNLVGFALLFMLL